MDYFDCRCIDIDIVLYNESIRPMDPENNRWNRGIIFFIILTMVKDGPIYGNQVANMISEKTGGAWKPGAGSIYPALDRLRKRGFVERYEEGGKVMYKITEKGQALISKIKERHFEQSPISKYMGRLWMETMGPEEKLRFLISSAQHINEFLSENLEGIMKNVENPKQYEAFLISLEVEAEKTIKIVNETRKKFLEN
ncbi:MAG: PadR family transcriptional regulator [Thermoplasmatales archaeon]